MLKNAHLLQKAEFAPMTLGEGRARNFRSGVELYSVRERTRINNRHYRRPYDNHRTLNYWYSSPLMLGVARAPTKMDSGARDVYRAKRPRERPLAHTAANCARFTHFTAYFGFPHYESRMISIPKFHIIKVLSNRTKLMDVEN
ncbi:hypothetical protein EVAR_22992_1 [Eumeta japonica]|uniref:Uncharacterized protein n=1 Tax=Eumeta variegata TaxID=151549 RepID=A0A4C1UQ10_EUMVA|nr:hypothetical protein EVAR_22992_1 [Eumeta japonica]